MAHERTSITLNLLSFREYQRHCPAGKRAGKVAGTSQQLSQFSTALRHRIEREGPASLGESRRKSSYLLLEKSKNSFNFTLTPTPEAGACRDPLEKCIQFVPDHHRCAPSLSLLNLRFLCCLKCFRQAQRPFAQERPTSLLELPARWWSGPAAPTRLQPVTSRPPTGCRMEKEPCGSFPFYDFS